MISISPCVRSKKMGRVPLLLKVIANRSVSYVSTPWLVDPETDLRDGVIVKKSLRRDFDRYVGDVFERLERVDARTLTAKDIKVIAEGGGDTSISFTRFARDYIIKRERDGLKRSDNYDAASKSLHAYAGANDLKFADLTYRLLQGWYDSLKGTKRAASMYPMLVRKIYKEAMREYNDPDKGIERIKPYPDEYLRKAKPIGGESRTSEMAMTSAEVRAFADADLTLGRFSDAVARQIAHAAVMLSFCLAGMNLADLYDLPRGALNEGKIRYNRAKTKGKREDNAHLEVTIPDEAKPYLDTLMTGAEDGRLLCLSARYRDRKELPSYIRRILMSITKTNGLRHCTAYSFRYSFASIAVNECGVPLEEVAFALNHASAHKVTAGYVKKDFSRVDRVVRAVLDKVFGGGLVKGGHPSRVSAP